MTRDLGSEIDALKRQVAEIEQLIRQLGLERTVAGGTAGTEKPVPVDSSGSAEDEGAVFYSGQFRGKESRYMWEPQERRLAYLLGLNGDKAAKILNALGHKQRLDILRAVLKEPLTGTEIVERLNMGTTGQLYHHLKALLGADLLVQEERGGRYAVPPHRTLPLLLLLAAVSDLMDTSDYMEMSEVREHPDAYLDVASQDGYDAHLLLWEVVENSILEHLAGYCNEVRIFLHDDGSATVSDNGRGIPVQVLPQTSKPAVQTVLTDMSRLRKQKQSVSSGDEKGISIAVVNALSYRLTVEIRRNGSIYRQEYKHGIPQTGLMTVGTTKETGTSVTFKPNPELFGTGFDRDVLQRRLEELTAAYPGLNILIEQGNG